MYIDALQYWCSQVCDTNGIFLLVLMTKMDRYFSLSGKIHTNLLTQRSMHHWLICKMYHSNFIFTAFALRMRLQQFVCISNKIFSRFQTNHHSICETYCFFSSLVVLSCHCLLSDNDWWTCVSLRLRGSEARTKHRCFLFRVFLVLNVRLFLKI